MNSVHIAFIADNNYVIPTATAIYSIIKNKAESTLLHVYILTADISAEKEEIFFKLQQHDVKIHVIQLTAKKYEGLHSRDESAPCVASIAALLKFDIPNVLSQLDKVLYLDGDLIVREDLTELFNTNINDVSLAAVADSGSIYYKHPYVLRVKNYFNSGVMLFNLKRMREENATDALIAEKKAGKDSFLMDQNVFNVVFDEKIRMLPIRYNLLYVNLMRARDKYSIEDINSKYGTNYQSLDEISEDAVIIHYSSKDKPWKSFDVPLGEEWRSYFHEVSSICGFAKQISGKVKSVEKNPKISVIVPVYNTEAYLEEALASLAKQTLQEIEIICINDGSTDESLKILQIYAEKDSRFRIFSQSNSGQSVARNIGIKVANGDYVYFFDSDDLLVPYALETMYHRAEQDHLDLLLFDGVTFYDTEELERKFPQYKNYYIRKQNYPYVYDGKELYVSMVTNGDYKVSPCLQLFSRNYLQREKLLYLEGIIYEDNLFAMQAILKAKRVGYSSARLFMRRVRNGSTMTRHMTFRSFRGYFICLQAMYLFVLESSFPDDVVATIHRQIKHFERTTVHCYKSLSTQDKRKPWCEGQKEKMFSDLLYKAILLEGSKEYQSALAVDEIRNIHASASYRIGRFITFIPRKLRGGIRCYQEHGWSYTWQRVLVHLGIKKDG